MARSDDSAFLLGRKDIHEQWQSDYLNSDMDRFYDFAFRSILSEIGVKNTERVLDAGCGFGYHARRIAASGAQVTGIDFSPAALSVAAKTLFGLENVSLQQDDLTRLSFATGEFDHVVCWGVLMHVPDLHKAVDELVRVLKVGGKLVICENNQRAPDIAIRERVIRFFRHRNSEVTQKELGLEIWTGGSDGGLMVRKLDIPKFIRSVESRGLKLTKRMAGQFTEAYTNMPTRALKRAIYALNLFYFRKIGAPSWAAGNILFFEKTEQTD